MHGPIRMRSLDTKLERIAAGHYRPTDFIIADAKDADMSVGVPTAGAAGSGWFPVADYRRAMRDITASGLVDVMLMSLSSAEALAKDGTFEGSPVTPAIRLNDTTDIWAGRGGVYQKHPALPFATARLEHARRIADLGLYAITFCNDPVRDVDTLTAYRIFREAAEEAGMRHFLEVFNPMVPVSLGDTALGDYMNDMIVRCLAGVAQSEAPRFLKVAYNGPRAMEDLAGYDPGNLIVGILGGGSGTTRDTMELVCQAERHGARVALFGRKIRMAEDPPEIIAAMRRVVEGQQSPEDAVRDYHDRLKRKKLSPRRPLADDLEITEPVLRAG